jgi:plasmid stabilization system protein ParE
MCLPRIRKSAAAETDLDDIWLRMALDNVDAASALIRRIEAQGMRSE